MDRIPYNPPPEPKREIHPAGTFPAVCVDIIHLGMRVREFEGKRSAAESIVLVFSTGKRATQGADFLLCVSQEFTFSLHDRANLKKVLEGWRGRAYTAQEKGSSFDIVGEFFKKPALLSIVHKDSRDGTKTYANIGAVMALPEAMPAPEIVDYERAPFWEERKTAYATDFKRYSASILSGDEEGGDVPF